MSQRCTAPRAICYWIVLLAAAVLRSLKLSLAPFKISVLQFIVLELCQRQEANTISSIARLTHYDPSIVSRHVETYAPVDCCRRAVENVIVESWN